MPPRSQNVVVAVVEDPGLTVAAVARRMGVAPATLRTWDRRYGIGPGQHTPGSHRRYSAEDLARLEHMRRLVIAGVPPADAARSARSLDLSAPPELEATVDAASVLEEGSVAADEVGDTAHGRAGGGRVLAQPGAGPVQRGLARAAQSLDVRACETIISGAIAGKGVVWTWDRLLVPVLVAVGDQWKDTGRGIEIEHALSQAIITSLGQVSTSLTNPVNSRAILLAGAPQENHTLPLWAVSAALAERRIASRMLGIGLPTESLAEAVDRIGPAAVFVWAQVPESADAGILADLPAHRPRASVLAGGPGWHGTTPAGVVRVHGLADAVAQIAHAVGE